MKYNILYVIDNLEFGGGERGFLQLAAGLGKDKYRIYVACNPGGMELRRENIVWSHFPHLFLESSFQLLEEDTHDRGITHV